MNSYRVPLFPPIAEQEAEFKVAEEMRVLGLNSEMTAAQAAEDAKKAQQHSTAAQLKTKNGAAVRGASGQNALVPSNFDINAVLKAGVHDQALSIVSPKLGAAATAADLG